MIGSGEWIVFRDDSVYPPYLRQLLTSDWFHPEFMRTVSGVGGSLVRARPSNVAKIKVPLPPFQEQRRTAAILDQAKALQAKRRQALAKLDTLTQSLFLSKCSVATSTEMSQGSCRYIQSRISPLA